MDQEIIQSNLNTTDVAKRLCKKATEKAITGKEKNEILNYNSGAKAETYSINSLQIYKKIKAIEYF